MVKTSDLILGGAVLGGLLLLNKGVSNIKLPEITLGNPFSSSNGQNIIEKIFNNKETIHVTKEKGYTNTIFNELGVGEVIDNDEVRITHPTKNKIETFVKTRKAGERLGLITESAGSHGLNAEELADAWAKSGADDPLGPNTNSLAKNNIVSKSIKNTRATNTYQYNPTVKAKALNAGVNPAMANFLARRAKEGRLISGGALDAAKTAGITIN